VANAEVNGLALPVFTPALDHQCMTATAVAIASMVLMAPREPDPAGLEAVSRQLLRVAREYSALDMMAAFGAQNRVTRSVGAFFTEYDLLITPTLGRLPAPHGTLRYDDPGHTLASWLQAIFDYGPFTMVFNISGQPAISLPLGQSDGGLPIGVQFIAPYGREDLLLQIASQMEQAMPWNRRIPRFFVGRA
jgi:amidase